MIDRTLFNLDLHGALVGSVDLGERSFKITLISPTGNIEAAWANLERVCISLRDQMSSIESAVRELFLRLGDPSEETPAGRRKIEHLLGRLAESNADCLVYEDSASVFFAAPRLTGHCIQVDFRDGKVAGATIAG